jgi:hypothetical protein
VGVGTGIGFLELECIRDDIGQLLGAIRVVDSGFLWRRERYRMIGAMKRKVSDWFALFRAEGLRELGVVGE